MIVHQIIKTLKEDKCSIVEQRRPEDTQESPGSARTVSLSCFISWIEAPPMENLLRKGRRRAQREVTTFRVLITRKKTSLLKKPIRARQMICDRSRSRTAEGHSYSLMNPSLIVWSIQNNLEEKRCALPSVLQQRSLLRRSCEDSCPVKGAGSLSLYRTVFIKFYLYNLLFIV